MLKTELQVTFYGSTTCQHDGDPERMPTLEEVFQQFPDVPINLDIKGTDDELMEKVPLELSLCLIRAAETRMLYHSAHFFSVFVDRKGEKDVTRCKNVTISLINQQLYTYVF